MPKAQTLNPTKPSPQSDKPRAQTAKKPKPQRQNGSLGSCAGIRRAPGVDPCRIPGDPCGKGIPLTLLTLREAKGGGVSVRSLIISTSDTYCKFTSRMSAWLGLPLEEGHSASGGD